MGKKFLDVKKKMDQKKEYSLSEAIGVLKENSFVSFDETLDVAINLGVDPKKTSELVRGSLILPKGSGQKRRIAVICNNSQLKEAQEAGADVVGSEDLIEKIKRKEINFDICICTNDMVSVLSSIARILGPKGLMPNAKMGTITSDVTQTIQNFKLGQIEYRMDKYSIIHTRVGKLSFLLDDLVENIKSLIKSVVKAKPTDFKGIYLKRVHLSSSMGLGLRINLSSIL